ncbi:ATP-binding protein [Actinacidiphila sp. bgisy145]|uniref:ATP-binding protein n=1 Tax=Actinacidiphila sp. bgisy145 TaxID=3413792 RepID=UPI003EBDEA5D
MPSQFRYPGFRSKLHVQIRPPSTERYRVRFRCEPSAIRGVRADASRKFAEWALAEGMVDDALTVVSELATNAVRHAGACLVPGVRAAGEPSLLLDLRVAAGALYVAVHDGSDQAPVVRPASEDVETGRGLRLVAGLSDGAWGFYPRVDGPGKVVWAALRLEAGSPTTGHVPGQAVTERHRKWGTDFRERVRAVHRLGPNGRYRAALENLRRRSWVATAAAHDTHPR